MQYALIYNPKAGRGGAEAVATEAAAWLEGRGHGARRLPSDLAGNRVSALAERMAVEVDRIVVLGGDGTVREAARGLLAAVDRAGGDAPAALAVLPMGSGNVVARELGLPLAPMAALAALEAGEEESWDVGLARADGAEDAEVFLAMAGLGFDANIATAVDRMRNTWLGGRVYRWSGDVLYGLAGAVELGRVLPVRFSITDASGVALSRGAAAAVICNSRIYGKGMVLAPDASPGDGLLDAVIRESAAPWRVGTMMARAQGRRPISGHVARVTRGTSFSLEARGPRGIRWQLDGDPIGRCRTLELGLRPGALRIVRAGPSVTPT